MARTRQARFDLRGGVTLAHSTEITDTRELRRAQNMREGDYGAKRVRGPTQRLHENAIGFGEPIQALEQWFPPTGRQLVAVAGGNLWYRDEGDTEFTSVPGEFNLGVRISIQAAVSDGVPTLYIADGRLWRWDGTTLSQVLSPGVPAATQIALYKLRLFALDGTSRLYWSRISNPEFWTTPFGGSAPVETYASDPLVGLENAGSSLLFYKANSIARFTGVSPEDIRLDQETDGVSADVGAVAPGAITRVEDVNFFVSDRGPYIASESGTDPATGVPVKPAFDEADREAIKGAVSIHNRGRNEILVFIPSAGSNQNDVGWCFHTRTRAWTGPWSFGGFNVAAVARFEREDNSETVVLGGYDGFVREMDARDVPWRDDLLRDGSAGVRIPWGLTYPDIMFGSPGSIKVMSPTQWITAKLGRHEAMSVEFTADDQPPDVTVLESQGDREAEYEVRPGSVGRRITVRIEGVTEEDPVQINGILMEADVPRRTGL